MQALCHYLGIYFQDSNKDGMIINISEKKNQVFVSSEGNMIAISDD